MFGARSKRQSNLEALLIELRHADRLTQSILLRKISVAVNEEGEEGISLLLEYITSAGGIEICAKLLFVLADVINENPAHYQRVACCPDVYDSACRVLGTGLLKRATAVLALLTVLQECGAGGGEQGARAGVAEYARGRVRVSGCLAAMLQLVFKDVMYASTWRALCTCLAASCRGCEANQSACSPLLPYCVGKCCSESGAEAELLQLLQALVEAHAGNLGLFLQCRGLDIFTRKVLVRGEGAWLLKTVVEGSPEAARLAYRAAVPQTLAQLITTHGADSQVGRWCSVCLFHISTGLQKYVASEKDQNNTEKEYDFSMFSETIQEHNDEEINIGESNGNQNDLNSIIHQNYFNNQENIIRKTIQSKEQCATNTHPNTNDNFKLTLNVSEQFKINHKTIPECTLKKSLSNIQTQIPSELVNGNNVVEKPLKRPSSVSNYSQTSKSSFAYQTGQREELQNTSRSESHKSCQTSFDKTTHATKSVQASFSNSTVTEFHPIAFSTPRRLQMNQPPKKIYYLQSRPSKNQDTERETDSITNSEAISTSKLVSKPKVHAHSQYKPSNIHHTKRENGSRSNSKFMPTSQVISKPKELTHSHNKPRKIHNTKRENGSSTNSKMMSISKLVCKPKETKQMNQSLGCKLFRSFNASCGSVLQVVQSYLSSKNYKNTSMVTSNATKQRVLSRDMSFTQYMHEYTAQEQPNVQKKRHESIDFSHITEYESLLSSSSILNVSEAKNACKTCNDTANLQRKVQENEYLKQAVDKLKTGIHLYGCNFKRIAKTYWPNDPYMTSAALYNLYRKLIVKKPSQK